MKNEVVELLEARFIYIIDNLTSDTSKSDIGKKKYFFINYGLKNTEYANVCLDFLILIDQINTDLKKIYEADGWGI